MHHVYVELILEALCLILCCHVWHLRYVWLKGRWTHRQGGEEKRRKVDSFC
jgi:hypothetical protein